MPQLKQTTIKNPAILAFLTVFCFSSFGTTKKYYCTFNKNGSLSSFDKIVLLQGEKPQRSVDFSPLTWSVSKQFFKTFDEGTQITTSYKTTDPGSRHSDYWILKLDLSSPAAPVASYGYGRHILPSEFEHSYREPFSLKTLKSYNRTPEWLRYMPKKSHPGHISLAFIKRTYTCRQVSALKYPLKAGILILLQILSG